MFETFAALLLAHAVADFLLQTKGMVRGKRRVGPLIGHGAVVLVTAMVATGQVDRWELLALAAAHMVIDLIKAWVPRISSLTAYLVDQAAHLASLLVIAQIAPDLWASGFWSDIAPMAPQAMLWSAGFVLVTLAGGHAIAFLMTAHMPLEAGATDGLPRGGQTIGFLERAMIYALVLAGEPGAIGFLIAAKSILRFGTVSENRAASEYVIIGTLASFAWALGVALVIGWLAPLEIIAPRP